MERTTCHTLPTHFRCFFGGLSALEFVMTAVATPVLLSTQILSSRNQMPLLVAYHHYSRRARGWFGTGDFSLEERCDATAVKIMHYDKQPFLWVQYVFRSSGCHHPGAIDAIMDGSPTGWLAGGLRRPLRAMVGNSKIQDNLWHTAVVSDVRRPVERNDDGHEHPRRGGDRKDSQTQQSP